MLATLHVETKKGAKMRKHMSGKSILEGKRRGCLGFKTYIQEIDV